MRRLIFAFVLVVFITFWASDVLGIPQPVPEPQLQTTTGWDLTPTGMLIVGYDLNDNGRPDYFTLRIVVRSYFSVDSVQATVDNCPKNVVFFVNYGEDRYFYIADQKPLFYVFDEDEDRHWDLIYKDVLVDGINGNESFYDSPSGKYSPGGFVE
mgnify:CR=1 FL=1|jgi:hypothetical protein